MLNESWCSGKETWAVSRLLALPEASVEANDPERYSCASKARIASASINAAKTARMPTSAAVLR